MTEITTITKHGNDTTTKTQYRCDKCFALYDTESKAEQCETKTHDTLDKAIASNVALEYVEKDRFPIYIYVPFRKEGGAVYNIQLYKHCDMDSISAENAERIADHFNIVEPTIEPDPGEDAGQGVVPGNPPDPNDPQAAVDETGENNNTGNNDNTGNVDPVDPNTDPEGEGAGGNENTDNTGGSTVDPVDDPNANTVDDVDPLNNPGTDPSAATDESGSNEGSNGNSGSSVEPVDVGNNDPDPEEIDP